MSFIDDSSSIGESAGQTFRIYDAGSGPAVVVLHGWGGRIESMAPVLQCLGSSFRTIALDLPGFGASPLPDDPWDTSRYAGFVAGVLAQRDVEAADFVGHSYGAKTALYLAATQPRLVKRLILVSSSGLRTPPNARVRFKRFVSRVGRGAGRLGPPGKSLQQALYRRIASRDYQDAGDLRPTLVKVVNEDLKDLLPRVRASTLLVWGSRDASVPLQHARTMEERIPDAGLVIFEGAGHFPYLDQQERFCRVARSFLTTEQA
jgi:pimeloyl-ACP methyl ester carboxylesterase